MYGETGKRISTTALGKLLVKWGFVDRAFTARQLNAGTAPKGVSDETYGRDSYIYVSCGTPERRAELERKLSSEGLRFSPDYYPGSGVAEIAVTYFRGHHWRE
jgi:hypothetical protein